MLALAVVARTRSTKAEARLVANAQTSLGDSRELLLRVNALLDGQHVDFQAPRLASRWRFASSTDPDSSEPRGRTLQRFPTDRGELPYRF